MLHEISVALNSLTIFGTLLLIHRMRKQIHYLTRELKAQDKHLDYIHHHFVIGRLSKDRNNQGTGNKP